MVTERIVRFLMVGFLKIRKTSKNYRRGVTLVELLVGIIIIAILCFAFFAVMRPVLQKVKVARSQASITQYTMILETVKEDVNYYPQSINETLEVLNSKTAPYGLENGWRGPYLEKTPIDPWGTPYFYKVEAKVFFGPVLHQRSGKGPFEQVSNFQATPGQGFIIIDNSTKIIHAGRVWLNGVEIISPNEFTGDQPRIEKSVTLLANNTLKVQLTSNPKHYVIITISGFTPNNTTYVLGSYGSDKEPGGTGFAQDLIWISGQPTGNFGSHWQK